MKNTTQRWWDVPAAIFLFGALLSAAIRLHATNWTEHLGLTELIVIIGAIAGFALGKSMFSGRVTFFIGLVYSLFFVPWRLGLLLPGLDWLGRMQMLYARLYWATSDFLRNQPVTDPILFLSTMLALFWFASLLSSYRLVRNANPWVPLFSLGGMVLVIEYTMELYRYTRIVGGTYSFLFLVFCLLLMGRIYYLRSKKEWEQRGGTVEMEVGYDLGRGVAVAAIAVALLAWNTPRIINFFNPNSPAQERVSRTWEVFRDRISKAVNSLQSPSSVVVEGYGSNLFLGTGGTLGDQVVFTVEPSFGRPVGRFYWAARTYDRYDGRGQWASEIDDSINIGPGLSPITYPEWSMRDEMQFTFKSRIPLLKTLYYIAEPLNINRDAEAVVAIAEDGATDLNTIVLEPPLRSGESYTVRALVPRPSVTAMREAGEDYPEYIKERYLQLPSGFSERIAELALQIVGEEATSYDRVQAVTQYLRRTISYTESIPEPPTGRDPIEWFLFDLRAGFCNYYATAEVLMLRSLGIPSRMVVGYAEGDWDEVNEEFVVIGRDSHAWPEAYFPGLGWVPFEPTVSQPLNTFPLGRRSDAGAVLPPPPLIATEPTPDPRYMQGELRAEELLNQEFNTRSIWNTLTPWRIALIAALLTTVTLVFLEKRRRRIEDLPLPSWLERTLDERGFKTPEWLRMWSRRSLRTPMENLFSSISFMLKIWGLRVDPAQTPAEQIAVLVNAVPAVKPQALALLEEYQRAMYSQYPANLFRARQAVKEIRATGYRTWLMRLVGLEAAAEGE